MEDTRKAIEGKYEKLQQLEDYEKLIEYLNNESRNHCWKISTPKTEVKITTSKARDRFIMFISDEIFRIKTELGI